MRAVEMFESHWQWHSDSLPKLVRVALMIGLSQASKLERYQRHDLGEPVAVPGGHSVFFW